MPAAARGPGVSVIIPALDEEAWIGRALAALRCGAEDEVIVVDGGSRDATTSMASAAGARVVRSGRGRGVQMNAGAAAARRDLFLFLHADARLDADALPAVRSAFSRPDLRLATFRRRFDRRGFWLDVSAALSRIDSIWTRFGDQGIVIRRSFFSELGGFPDWPLFEDVRLLRLARARTRSPVLPAEILVSTRRYDRTGVFRGQCANTAYLVRYLRGEPPARIAADYERMPPPGVPPGMEPGYR